ncbi:metallophosphoesterase [Rhizobium tumorigenes]|uniref:Metallophosphoesterase n=1 Tax=Rhizobium tumorigenes TaxID=2041385 RepID=A0AAF1KWQ3_9HYPH|nr:metallophosphoesterase [Rhizobium tumorigenes]WFR97569.1 metallophosphoesterase [Rhizobium tumorigenes]WFS03171.1 metallophosphoesterase [Rhizobium tumorigenes]
MKLWVLSDLHLEHAAMPDLAVPHADICVVAGDVMTKGVVPSLEWLDANIAPHMPVVFCAGNHEFYRAFLRESLSDARRWQGSGRVYFLEDSSVTLDGVTFCGSTLWTDFDLLGEDWSDIAQRTAAADLNDYRMVKYGKQPFKPLYPLHTFQKHVVSRRFLEDCVREHGDGKLVFVTHHAPSFRSVEDRFRKDVLSAAYASDMEYLMGGPGGPELWVHGHLHNTSDYMVGSTRVVSNPRGYPREPSYQVFDQTYVVEV